jgi:hypothetical protein
MSAAATVEAATATTAVETTDAAAVEPTTG